MRIIGIDPGLESTGWGIVDFENRNFSLVSYGVIKTSNKEDFLFRLITIADDAASLVEKYKPDVCSMEDIFFAKNTATAITVAKVIGALVLRFKEKEIDTFLYTPLQVKTAVSGMGRAEKKQVQEMVKVILKLKDIPRPDHAADALADCICHCTHKGGLI